ncbi:alpha/beta hydrolase [Thermobifida halotolerans]|uniref:Alpha/beta hydrolase n=1 Tax=Thermobifida halotolerans TaxID=483545 RepID=A0A399G8A5_9ACTN|nr:alpha/beta fold hydrolase [Thermobifida halotolerans]UOE20753.1 alpha/beta hydrolase [Thermobifida halotolerans]
MDFGIRPPDRLGATPLPDGRRLGWAQWGPDDAEPVLFFSGAAMGRGLGFGSPLLAARGLRLICVERPGLGVSDPLPGRTFTDWTRDVRDLTAALELPGCTIVGFSHGAPFALACAAAGVGDAVAVVSGADDLAHPALAPLLAPDLARTLRSVAADPAAFEAAATGFDADAMWDLVIRTSSTADRAVYTAPDFAAAYRACLAEGFAQGAAGYARDLVLAFTPWPFDLARITVPVELWYGAHDTGAVHSPDHGATLAARIPTARRHLLDDAGGSLLWTHGDRVLDSLTRARDHRPG